MILVGLTGGIGSGKSTVLRVFKKLGAEVIDADRVARMAVAPGAPAWRRIRERFGLGVFHKNGRLNRKKLAGVVFCDKKALADLNAIVHPPVFAIEKQMLADIARRRKNAVVVIAVPLLIETGSHKWKDVVVVVASTEEEQLERLCKSGKFTRAEALARIRAQMPLSKKLRHADHVIENHGTLAELRRATAEVYRAIVRQGRK
ncbi:MAG: dephospho-CoA kinase [Nitrospinae bacterium]|nr:dephospho-CoA kinase [Nitrospinota bacterium]